MSAIADERFEQIKEIVCEILELEEDEVTATSLFREDHGADSLRAIEILASLEKQFKIVIDQAELSRMVHLDAVVEVVTESLAAKSASAASPSAASPSAASPAAGQDA